MSDIPRKITWKSFQLICKCKIEGDLYSYARASWDKCTHYEHKTRKDYGGHTPECNREDCPIWLTKTTQIRSRKDSR